MVFDVLFIIIEVQVDLFIVFGFQVDVSIVLGIQVYRFMDNYGSIDLDSWNYGDWKKLLRKLLFE